MEHLEILNSGAFWALLAVPVIIAAGFIPAVKARAPRSTIAALAAAVTFFTLAFAVPKVINTVEFETFKEKQIIGLLDDSGSMTLCIAKGNRTLEQFTDKHCADGKLPMWHVARHHFSRFAEQRTNDDIAVTIFSDDATVVSRLGDGYGAASSKLNLVPSNPGGTDIAAALNSAIKQFKESEGDDRVLILITDAVDPMSVGKVLDAAMDLRELKIKVYMVRMLDEYSFNETMPENVQALLHKLGGRIFDAANAGEVALAMSNISQLEKSEPAVGVLSTSTSLVWFLFMAGNVCLFLHILGLTPKKREDAEDEDSEAAE